ncbi:hypothetical protein HanOQP8_Chr17g0658661 [Helianthus annuus]|nr:hypothetical protein HanIR_Chr17g0868651 [Helianthus annuus]KAJ0636149.1 hypothetical protein HanOQP8_Chr17g0658661 [Helianthus annuus]
MEHLEDCDRLCYFSWAEVVCTLLYLVIFSLLLRDWCSILVDDHQVSVLGNFC